MDNKDNDMASSKDNSSNNTTKLNGQCLLQMETQTLDDTLATTSDSPFDDVGISNESSTTKDEVITDPSIDSEEAAEENESVKESKKRLYMMGRSAYHEYNACNITKLEREIKRLRLENEKLKIINFIKEMESINKRKEAITKLPGENKLHNDDNDDDDDDDDDEASPDDDTNIVKNA